MLQNEPENQSVSLPASQIRVSAEELTAAINALEAQNAQHLQGTVPIGQVVEELHLSSTPEEIWAQVQWQREKAAAMQAKPTAVHPAVSFPAKRRLVRGWQGVKWWLWIIFWCSGGLGLFSSASHWFQPRNSSATMQPTHPEVTPAITINGDLATSVYSVSHQDVAVNGDKDTVTLKGNVRNLYVDGDGDTIVIVGSAERVLVDKDKDGNVIHWTREPAGKTTQIQDNGDGNQVGLSAP